MESLYRKYRPQTFDDVVGQSHVVETLEHAVLEGRTSHAYLFCGPRGTGKTTMARLLAKALMCEQGPGHLPDGTCEQCRLIAEGEHPDVYELDAASRTGVDNVREEIINRVNYAPAQGRYKVYIIDEVHMLTTAAFNALLKTLEEPPSHVVFVLCTTDPQKIPATILSRVQRFDFHAIGNDDMRARLAYVCEQEGFTYDEAALDLIVRHARGGMRDALSTLEQLSVFGDGEVSLDTAQDLLGEVPGSSLCAVSAALASRDVAALFDEVAKLVDSGRDLLQFTRELAAHMRDVYVVAAVGARPGVVQASGEALERLGQEAAAFGSHDRVARILSILGDASSEMRTATNQRLVLEIALTRMARPQADVTLESLAERIDELERQVAALSAPGSARPAGMAVTTSPAGPDDRSRQRAGGRDADKNRSAAQKAPIRKAAPATTPDERPGAGHEVPTPEPASKRDAGQGHPTAPAKTQRPQAQTSAPSRARATSGSSREATMEPTGDGGTPTTDKGQLQRKWKQVVDTLVSTAASRGSLLMNSTIVADDGTTLKVSLPKGSGFALRMLERSDVRSSVDPVVAQVFGPRKVVFGEAAPQDEGAGGGSHKGRRGTTGARRQGRRPQAANGERRREPAPQAEASRAPQASAPKAGPAYEMPWDQPAGPRSTTQEKAATPEPQAEEVPYEAVPYDDASATSYDEAMVEEGFVSGAPVQQVAPTPAAATSRRPPEDPKPSTQPKAPETSGEARQDEVPTPATPMESDNSAAGEKPTHEVPDDIPPDLIAIVESAFEVFGDGVKISKA